MKTSIVSPVLAALISSSCASVPIPSSLPLESQKDIVSSQLWFMLCKTKANEYIKAHKRDMENLLEKKRIDLSLAEDPSVIRDAQSKISKNGCSIFEGKARIGDLIPNDDPRVTYNALKPWEQEVIRVVAHSGCMQRNGEWTKKQQNIYIASQIDKIPTPSSFTQDTFISFIKDNLGVIGMLDASMRQTPDCSLPFGWRP